jgi:predicted nucleic acid-binding protein
MDNVASLDQLKVRDNSSSLGAAPPPYAAAVRDASEVLCCVATALVLSGRTTGLAVYGSKLQTQCLLACWDAFLLAAYLGCQ